MPMSPQAAERAILQRNRLITQLTKERDDAIAMTQRAHAVVEQVQRTFWAVVLATVGADVDARLTVAVCEELETNPLRYAVSQRQDPATQEIVFRVHRRTDEEVAMLEAEQASLAKELAAQQEQEPREETSSLVGADGTTPLRQTAGKLTVIQ